MRDQGVARRPIELWGGAEATINRVGDTFFDQSERSGHANRIDDLDRFASLGITALRFPVLWERTAPNGLQSADWSYSDARLARLRELGLRPIVGLSHHGSGPRSTDLLDPEWGDGLARYAGAVAERYPAVDAYTPVNEPLTTARFSALYGIWYPHAADPLSFARALLHECRATVLAMRAIRAVNPAAQLIQTEDLAKIWSTPTLAYQAEFENERRWITFDLLCGKLDRDHLMWQFLRWVGIAEAELVWFREHPCPPDILGFNYYLTSERWLDERVDRYPPDTHGSNDRHRYADVAAVRVRGEGLAGPREMLLEAWERYGRPLAITEMHNGCSREEQMRWIRDVWNAAQEVWHDGIDLRAVTAWSLLGAFGWSALSTNARAGYEAGVWDVRGSAPRPTAVATLLRELVAGQSPSNPAIAGDGWWRLPRRFLYGGPVDEPPPPVAHAGRRVRRRTPAREPSPLAIVGASGTLGNALRRLCELRGLHFRLLSHAELDIADPVAVAGVLGAIRPWAVVNAAGWRGVEAAEEDRDGCFRVNATGPAVLAAWCARQGSQLLTFSSDLVFDGHASKPYLESDPVNPLTTLGASKAAMEARVLAALPAALVVRSGPFFGPWDRHNFATRVLHELARGASVDAAADLVVAPTYIPDLVHFTLDLLIDGANGIWHVANTGAMSWAEFARLLARRAGYDPALIQPTRAAPSPRATPLESERGGMLQDLDAAVDCYFRDLHR